MDLASTWGRCAAVPKCVSYRFLQCFFDVGRFAYRTFVARKNFENMIVSDSKIDAQGVPARRGRAGSSGKTTKSGDKARSKQPDRADRGQIEPARASQVVRLLAQVERAPTDRSPRWRISLLIYIYLFIYLFIYQIMLILFSIFHYENF